MALEVIGVFVDQLEQIVHKFMQRPPCAELSDNRDQTRAPTREYLQRTYLPIGRALAGDRLPEHTALCRVDGTQGDHAKEVIQGLIGAVDLIEAAGGASQQDDPGFGLERFSEPPACVAVHHVPQHHVEIFHQEHEPFAHVVRKIEQDSETVLGEGPGHPSPRADLPRYDAGLLAIPLQGLAMRDDPGIPARTPRTCPPRSFPPQM